ncbi:MAG: ArsA family ATPase [Cyanobacteria bacterium J06633_2]
MVTHQRFTGSQPSGVHPSTRSDVSTQSIPVPHSLNECDRLQLALFSGKGGVGKTTLSCGFARRWAQTFTEETVLLISTDPAHSLGDVMQIEVNEIPRAVDDVPNLQVQALDAQALLTDFKSKYGKVLELLVERGSFVEGSDLGPVWDLSWPGLDELMGILEIQRLLREKVADRVVVDMAPTGHSLNLLGLMDFLDNLLNSLDLFQAKHREMSERLTGHYTPDTVDEFLTTMREDLAAGRQLLHDHKTTACFIVAIPEPMSWEETRRFLSALNALEISVGGIFVNRVLPDELPTEGASARRVIQAEQKLLIKRFLELAAPQDLPVFRVFQQHTEPVGAMRLDNVMTDVATVTTNDPIYQNLSVPTVHWPDKLEPSFCDFIADHRQLLVIGGKGGVGKTTVAAAIAWGMAARHPDKQVRVISIDPAHSLGDAFGQPIGHEVQTLSSNLSAQEIDADTVLEKFREEYLWELAEMMGGSAGDDNLRIAYGPEAWRQIVAQSLPGIDEMLSLLTIVELLDSQQQDLIVLDTAPTGHLLRFLEMPTALGDWLGWIFKLWIKYQDVVGRIELMGRLRTLRKRVMDAQKKLQNPGFTEFINVLQAQSAIVAESERLAQSLVSMNISHRYVVHNRYEPNQDDVSSRFPKQTVVKLPPLPRAIAPIEQIQGAADLLF